MKELPKFTGEPDQKVTQFVDAIEHIGTFTEWTEPALHTLASIKLGGLAFNWYNNNKDTLRTWPLLKANLLERFQPSISVAKTHLKTRRQQPDESLSTFYDDIIELCKQVDKDMPIYMIVDYLQDGVRDDLKVHIKRRMATIRGCTVTGLISENRSCRRRITEGSLFGSNFLVVLAALFRSRCRSY